MIARNITHNVLSTLFSPDGRLTKIYERLGPDEEPKLRGPDTVVFGNDGTMYALTEEGFLVSLVDFQVPTDSSMENDANPSTNILTAKKNGGGRPWHGSSTGWKV